MTKNNDNSLQKCLIKVGDLLHSPGSKDTLVVRDLVVDESVSHLVVHVQIASLSDHELFVLIREASFDVDRACDYCSKQTIVHKKVQNEGFTFMAEQYITQDLLQEDLIFPIDSDGTIDIFEAVRDSVLLSNDIQHCCQECTNRPLSEDEDEGASLGGSLIFT